MEKVLRRINSSESARLSLKIISHGASLILALAFFYELLVFILNGAYTAALEIAAFSAAGYAAVSIFRALLNAPRPYELYDFYTVPPKNKKGSSFPSRHTYSAFVIATLAHLINPFISVALYALGAVIAIARVLLGIHFIRDVAAGAILGILAGVMGLLLI